MINGCTEILNDIEVNIVDKGNIKDEMCRDKRIRREKLDNISNNIPGKALVPSELKSDYKDKKICYCCWGDRDFNETIITVFHESFHFHDPFDLKKCIERKEEIGDKMKLKGYLKYYIKANLSEFYANYKTASKLSNQSKFKDVFIKKVKDDYFPSLSRDRFDYEQINKIFKNKNQSAKLIEKILLYKFSEYFFRVIGIWRGFKKIDEFQFIQNEWNKNILKTQNDDYLAPGLYEHLVKILLDEPIELVENKIWNEFKEYFTIYHNFNIDI